MTTSREQRRPRLRGNRLAVVAAVSLAAAVRIAVVMFGKTYAFPSEWDYGFEMGRIAAALAEGHGFSCSTWHCGELGPATYRPTAWMSPLYPGLLGGLFRIFGSYSMGAAVAALLIQTAVACACCVLLLRLGELLAGARAGFIAAALFAFYPAAVHFSTQKIWSTVPSVALLLTLLLLVIHVSVTASIAAAALTGVVMGLSALMDPVAVAFYPFALLWLLAMGRARAGRTLLGIAVIVSTTVVIMSPWALRNYRVFGELVSTKSNFGHELYLGNNTLGADADLVQTRIALMGEQPTPLLTDEERASVRESNEARQSRVYARRALAFIRAEPAAFVKRCVQRFVRYWTVMRGLTRPGHFVATVAFLSIVLLAAVGAYGRRMSLPVLSLVLLAVASLPLPYYLTIVEHWRYRFPVEVLLLAPAAAGIDYLIDVRAARRARVSA